MKERSKRTEKQSSKPKKSKAKLEELIDESESGVALYRSYGVKRKLHWWTVLGDIVFEKLMLVVLFAFDFVIIGMGAVLVFTLGGLLVPSLIAGVLLSIVIIRTTRQPVSRFLLLGRMRRICKKKGWKYRQGRGFFRSLYWNDAPSADFTVERPEGSLYVKFATTKKLRISVSFLSESEMKYVQKPRKSIFALAFKPKTKTKTYHITFPAEAEAEGAEKFIIVNPIPSEILVNTVKDVPIPTGSGDTTFSYTIYSGNDFVGFLKKK